MDVMRPISMSINYVGSNRYLFQSDETLNDNIELPDNTEIILRNDAQRVVWQSINLIYYEYEKITVSYMYHIRYRCLRCLSMEK